MVEIIFTGKGAIYESVLSASDVDLSNPVTVGEGMEYSNNYAAKFSKSYFRADDVVGVTNLYADGSMPSGYERVGDYVKNAQTGEYVGGLTRNLGTKWYGASKGSNVYIFKSAFTSKEKLFLTMGHEYIHAAFNFGGHLNINRQEAVVNFNNIKVMKYILLIAVFFVLNTKSVISQRLESGMYWDTINEIIYNYYEFIPHENYPNDTILFPEVMNSSEKTYSFSDSLFLGTEYLINMKLPKTVSNNIFNILYMQDVVNRWQDYEFNYNDTVIESDVVLPDNFKPPYKDRNDYFKKAKSNFKMYLLGNIKINENFSSKLILVIMKNNFSFIRSLFLVNIKDNYLKSITEISECYSNADRRCICNIDLDIRILGNGNYSLMSGLAYAKKQDKEDTKQLYYYPVFYYDNEGYLHILKDCYLTPWLTGIKDNSKK